LGSSTFFAFSSSIARLFISLSLYFSLYLRKYRALALSASSILSFSSFVTTGPSGYSATYS
jgi:hypothetical protein